MIRPVLCGLLGLVVAWPAAAQELEFGGEVRPRVEIRDPVRGTGSLPGDGETVEFTSMRSRISLRALLARDVRAFVQFQDVRVWGSEESTTDASAQAIDLHQGWAELGDAGAGGYALRVGRQEIAYGGQRLIGSLNWAQQARSFDGARLRVRPSESAVLDAVAMQLGDEDAGTGDGALVGIHGSISAMGRLSGYAWYTGQDLVGGTGGDLSDLYTVGARWEAASGGIHWRLEAAYQAGETRLHPIGGPRPDAADVSAYLVAARAGTRLTDELGVDLWYDRLSGDDDPTDGELGVFNTLFATNHKFYGYMDLFLNIPVHTAGRGLQDLALKATYDVGETQTLGADLHGFFLAATDGVSSGHIGEELDLSWRWGYAEGVSVTGGVSYFWSGDAWSDPSVLARADENMLWGFLMLDVIF